MSTKEKSDLKRYRTKKLIEDLKDKRGFHTELISLYIPSDKKVSDIRGYLRNEISESQNIKSKLTRKNVLDSISSILGQLKTIPTIPEQGLIMFSGAIPQNDTPGTEKNELYIIDPPEKVNTFRYHCDSEFLLWPLEEMLESKATYGLIVISRQRSAVGYVRGNRVEVEREFTSGIHSKHKAGGQSQRRFERLIEEGEKRFYRRISDEINKIFLDMESLRGIFIGGPGPSKDKFMRDENLDYRLKEKIIDVVDLGYGGSEGIRALVERVKDKIEDIKYVQEKKLMEKFMGEISNDTGLATYGIKNVEKALNYGAAETVIISEELDQYRVKLKCNNCDYVVHRNIKVSQFKDKKSEIQNEICPECSSNSFGIIEKNSLVEDLGEMAESTGASIEIISTETELGESLYSTFGGVVALLRYKISF